MIEYHYSMKLKINMYILEKMGVINTRYLKDDGENIIEKLQYTRIQYLVTR